MLNGESVEPRELYIRPQNSKESMLVLYTYAPIQHERHGIIGMVIMSTSLSGIEQTLDEVRTKLGAYSMAIAVVIILTSFWHPVILPSPLRSLPVLSD